MRMESIMILSLWEGFVYEWLMRNNYSLFGMQGAEEVQTCHE